MSISESGEQIGVPHVVLNAEGSATAVWDRWDGNDMVVESADRPAGQTWQAPTDLSQAPGEPIHIAGEHDAFEPEIAIDDHGNETVVWTRAGASGLLVQSVYRPAGGSWQASVIVGEAHFQDPEPHVAVDGLGDATAAWDSGGVIEAAYRPAGGSWEAPVPLSSPSSYVPQLAMDRQGDATAVWMALSEGTLVTQTSYRPHGGTWAPASTLSNLGEEAGDPMIAVGPRGEAVAGWGGPQRALRATYRPAGGSWGPPTTLTEPGVEAANFPRLAVDDAGDALAVWGGYREHLEFVQSAYRPAGGSWEQPVILSNGKEKARPNDVAFDGLGDALTVWQQGGGTGAIGSAYRPAGGLWGMPTEVSEGGGEAFDAHLAFDTNGNAVAVWARAGIIQAADDVIAVPKLVTVTGVSCSPASVVASRSAACTATVTDASGGGTAPSGTIAFTTSGEGSVEGTCKLKSATTSSSSCLVTYKPGTTPKKPERNDTITATYEGDEGHDGSKGSTSVTVFSPTALARGAFVIGNSNATVGKAVTFYEANEWSRLNSLSGGSAPASFKGFADSSASSPACGEKWTSKSGTSSAPPATVPEYMEVVVASEISKSGSTISGNALEVVVVKNSPGYSPANKGTGKVVAAVCKT